MLNHLKSTLSRAQLPHFLSIGLALFLFSGNSFAGGANLAWDASTSSNVGGYKVSYGLSTGIYTSTIYVGNTTTYALSGLTEGTQYFFAVKAYDTAKTTESAYSNETSLTVPVTTTTALTADFTASKTNGALSLTATGPSKSVIIKSNLISMMAPQSPPPPRPRPVSVTSLVGLVAAYGFEEINGVTVVDASGNANNGTIKEAVRISTGKYGKALQFDGVNDWVTVNNSASLDLITGMTLEAWVYPQRLTGGGTAIMKEQSWSLDYALYASEDIGLPLSYITNGGQQTNVIGPSPLVVNNWTHLVTTFDGQYHRLYINGVEVDKSIKTGLIQQTNGVLRIGGNSSWGEFFQGYIDEVRIYNRALTAAEVIYNKATAISVSNPPKFVMGDKTLEPWVDYRAKGTAEAFQTVPNKSGVVTTVLVYLDSSSTATMLVAGIYKDNSGHPGTFVTQGILRTLKTGAWNSVSIPLTSVTAGQPYWIAIVGLGGQIGFLDQLGSRTGLMETSASTTLTSLPLRWTGSVKKTNAAMSVFVNGYSSYQ